MLFVDSSLDPLNLHLDYEYRLLVLSIIEYYNTPVCGHLKKKNSSHSSAMDAIMLLQGRFYGRCDGVSLWSLFWWWDSSKNQ